MRILLNNVCILPYDQNSKNWKNIITIDLTRYTVNGINMLDVEVQNAFGPPLLYLFINGLPDEIKTDHTWTAKNEGSPYMMAVAADDTRMNPDSLTIPSSMDILYDKYLQILFIFLSAVFVLLIVGRFVHEENMRLVAPGIFAGIALFWLLLFFYKILKMHPATGFDGPGHLQYIAYIIRNKSIPLPNEGWSMFHPPLYYVISAVVICFSPYLTASKNVLVVLKTIPFICGICHMWVVYCAAKKLFTNDSMKTAYALIFAGVLPMNIYMSSYVGNESLHAFIAGLSLDRKSVV